MGRKNNKSYREKKFVYWASKLNVDYLGSSYVSVPRARVYSTQKNRHFITYKNKIEEWSTNITAQAPLKKVNSHLRPKQPKEKQVLPIIFLKKSSQLYTSNANTPFPSIPKNGEYTPIDKISGLTIMPIQITFQTYRASHQKTEAFNKGSSKFIDFSNSNLIYN